MDQTTELYELNIDNTKQEDGLGHYTPSCAGNFSVLLDPSLNLSPLLYLRSLEAEMALSGFSTTGLPLSFTSSEDAHVLLDIPTDVAGGNQLFNTAAVKIMNKVPLALPNADHFCRTPKEVVEYMNDTFRFRVNFFFIARYLRIFMDIDPLPDIPDGPLTHHDIRLLLNYIDAALYTRNQRHMILCRFLDLTTNVARTVVYHTTKSIVSTTGEAKIISDSQCITPLADRTQTLLGTSVNFTLFHSKDITRPSEALDAIKTSIEEGVREWLTDLAYDLDNIDAQTRIDILKYIESNKKLIDVGLLARSLLFLEKDRIDRRKDTTSRLFQTDFFHMDLDLSKQRSVFFFQPKPYLLHHASATIYLPERMSYTLGSSPRKKVILGPFTRDMQTVVRNPRLSNSITSTFQSLPCAIRNLPSVIHLTCDLTCGKGSDTFLKSTPFSTHHIMYSYLFDQNTVDNRSIVATDCNLRYFKIKRSHTLLEEFTVCLLDENFQVVMFPTRTYTRLAFQIRPAGVN